MKKHIKVNSKIIKTYGELRPYIKSTRIARKFEDKEIVNKMELVDYMTSVRIHV